MDELVLFAKRDRRVGLSHDGSRLTPELMHPEADRSR